MSPIAIFGFDWTLELTFIACAAAGGTVLVLQTLLLLFGIGDGEPGIEIHHDVGGDHAAGEDHDGALGLLSVRALASFFTFFGLTGWFGLSKDWNPSLTVVIAAGAGLALMLCVAWLMRAQTRLRSEGNLDPSNAIGQSARVYLRIPARNSGLGKVQVKVQGRTAEFSAFTLGDALPTGALVRIERMSTPDTFEVAPLQETRP